MNKLTIYVIPFLIAAFLVSGASAITIESLDMQISENGDGSVTFVYSLSTLERFAVFMKITDPSAELKKVIDERTDREVEVQEVSAGRSSFFIPEFISPEIGPAGVTYSTPAIDFSKAEEILREYWFASLITIDLSPGTTTITFPDGYSEIYSDSIQIPSVTRTI
ncbi:MAG: hypothetical protein JW931_09860 [Methanomicrobiaceae archaeon]|nr:hypothetical protein [Methanomicrobiaceae archaeon]